MKITRVAGGLGAELTGIQLNRLDSTGLQAVREAYLKHGVVFFRDQELSSAEFLAFAGHMGEPMPYPFVKGLASFPEIIEVKKLEHETVNFGGVWHSDTTYLKEPPKGTMLLAREVPAFGGDTLFASQYEAYEALSPSLRQMLDGMKAISSSAKAEVSRTREDRVRDDGTEQANQELLAEHPVVRTHPETGRKALYVNEAHTVSICGLSSAESEALLRFLFLHQVRPEFTCRFVWRVGSMAFWDNRCVMHNPINDYHGQRRVMNRITLRGDQPR